MPASASRSRPARRSTCWARSDDRATDAIDLTGNDFKNLIVGNDGDNQLNGGGGADSLHGRGGADTFVFNTVLGPNNIYRINDFEMGVDRIELDDSVLRPRPGHARPGRVPHPQRGGRRRRPHHLQSAITGALLFDVDGAGGAAAVQFAKLDNLPANFSASDFIVV